MLFSIEGPDQVGAGFVVQMQSELIPEALV